MHVRTLVQAGLMTLLCSAASAAGPERYVATRDVLLQYDVANAAQVTTVELHVSTDSGRSWAVATSVDAGRGTRRYTAPADGKYCFYIILRNESGASAPPPAAGTPPLCVAVIDTTPPLLQFHDVRLDQPPDAPPTVALRASLVEENLSDEGLRVFYRAPDGPWSDGGLAQHSADCSYVWPLPRNILPPLDLRLVAADRAGNRATSETRRLPAESASTETTTMAATPTTQPAPSEPQFVDLQPVAPVLVEPVSGLVAPEPVPPEKTPAAQPPDARPAAPQPDPATIEEQLTVLRTMADGFMREGRFTLAAARLQDAVQLAPQDADLQVDLGSVLYRLRQYDQAQARFDSAASLDPAHAGALEGLALVAATQKRYPDAREHLRAYLRLAPESGSGWLRYGDIEHRLGNEAQAFTAWEKALQIADSEPAVRDQAQRRLAYFRPSKEGGEQTAGK